MVHFKFQCTCIYWGYRELNKYYGFQSQLLQEHFYETEYDIICFCFDTKTDRDVSDESFVDGGGRKSKMAIGAGKGQDIHETMRPGWRRPIQRMHTPWCQGQEILLQQGQPMLDDAVWLRHQLPLQGELRRQEEEPGGAWASFPGSSPWLMMIANKQTEIMSCPV